MKKILDLRKKSIQAPKANPTPETPRGKVQVVKNIQRVLQQPRAIPIAERYVQQPHISWNAPSFYYNPQKRHLSLLIISLLSGAVALLMFKYDTLTSIFLILSSLVLILYSNQKPTVSKIVINQSRILVDNETYQYKDIKSFWIEYSPGGIKELSLESAKWYLPYIKIMLNNQNPIEIRSLLINFLPEKEHENSIVDHIGRKLGL